MPNPNKFMSPDGYDAAAEYVRQSVAHVDIQGRAPRPEPSLLLTDPLHGPITSVRLANIDDKPQVAVSFHERNERYFDMLDFAAITLGTSMGMGLSVQDTGNDLGYPRFRVVEPEGQLIYLLRVLMNAEPWEVVLQVGPDGCRPDYHQLSRSGLSKQSVRQVWEEGKESRVPRLGRPEFLEAVKLYWTKNHEEAGIGVSLKEHLRIVKTAMELGDMTQMFREIGSGTAY